MKRLIDPKKKLQDYAFRNDELMTRLEHAMKGFLSFQSKDVQLLEKKLVSPVEVVKQLRAKLEKTNLMMIASMKTFLSKADYRLKNNMSLLGSLSPLNVVDRGYSITSHNNQIIKSVNDVKKNDEIEVKLKDGTLTATVTGTQKG
jgi:exodeoxyribonuclease VII large subunit